MFAQREASCPRRVGPDGALAGPARLSWRPGKVDARAVGRSGGPGEVDVRAGGTSPSLPLTPRSH